MPHLKLNRADVNLLDPTKVTFSEIAVTPAKRGILHFGVGNFFRSHLAEYTEDLMILTGEHDLGISPISTTAPGDTLNDALKAQDSLYTLVMASDEKNAAKIISSLNDPLNSSKGEDAIIEALADPSVQVVTLTITEGGYSLRNEFNQVVDQPVADLIARGLKKRFEDKIPPFVVLSCDNLSNNGDAARALVAMHAGKISGELRERIEQEVSFPNSMVDRITPASTGELRQYCAHDLMVIDKAPVKCEPFKQWVIEGEGVKLPNWDLVGAQYVRDVRPYEEAKLRLLNAGHTSLVFPGFFLPGGGYSGTVASCMANQEVRTFLEALLRDEVACNIKPMRGLEPNLYIDTVLERFSLRSIGDSITRIMEGSSAKFPKFLLPSVEAAVRANTPFTKMAFVVACWIEFINYDGSDSERNPIVSDPNLDLLQGWAGKVERSGDVSFFLGKEEIFGELAHCKPWIAEVQSHYVRIQKHGVQDTFRWIDNY